MSLWKKRGPDFPHVHSLPCRPFWACKPRYGFTPPAFHSSAIRTRVIYTSFAETLVTEQDGSIARCGGGLGRVKRI